MGIFRRFLCALLEVSTDMEQSKTERRLRRDLNKSAKLAQKAKADHIVQLQRLNKTIADLEDSIASIREMVSAREQTIEALEHQNSLLKYDIKGMAAVNARALKWMESLRMAEDMPTDGQKLSESLSDIEGNISWQSPTS